MIPVTDDVIEFEHSDWLAEMWFKYQEISESHQMPFLSLRSRDLGICTRLPFQLLECGSLGLMFGGVVSITVE